MIMSSIVPVIIYVVMSSSLQCVWVWVCVGLWMCLSLLCKLYIPVSLVLYITSNGHTYIYSTIMNSFAIYASTQFFKNTNSYFILIENCKYHVIKGAVII